MIASTTAFPCARLYITALLALGCIAAGCNREQGSVVAQDLPTGGPAGPEEVEKAKELMKKGGLARSADAGNDFGFRLLREALKGEPGANILVSPVSVTTALQMALNGAGGETRAAMEKTLGLQGLHLEEANQAGRAIRLLLENAGAGVKLTIANSIWCRRGVEFLPSFLEVNRKHFGAGIRTLDFSSPAAPDAINGWVREKTAGKIDSIVDRIEPETVLYLINAVYFNGAWMEPFNKDLTSRAEFHPEPGKSVPCHLMRQSEDFPYLQEVGFTAVKLPYKDGNLEMVIVLPGADSSMDKLIDGIGAGAWNRWMQAFRHSAGTVVLPRFKSEYGIVLNGPLKALGMEIAFDPARADLSGMRVQKDLFIHRVDHKTFIEVNELGTEAAAVTSIAVKAAAAPREPFQFIADRPFLYAIRHAGTGAILFLGILKSPPA